MAIEGTVAELGRFVAQTSAERSQLQVSLVEVEPPAEILRLGFGVGWNSGALGVAALARRSESCRVCRAVAAVEQDAVTDIATRTVVDPDLVPLCLRHVAVALAAGPTGEQSRALLRAVATALRRNSEDMRSSALKREALRAGLLTDEESRAYRTTLHLLAGRAALVRPWLPSD